MGCQNSDRKEGGVCVMSRLRMQRINLCALKKDRKQILECLQRSGVVEVCDIVTQDSAFERMDVAGEKAIFQKNIDLAKEALETIASYVPQKTSLFASLEGKKEVSLEEYNEFAKRYHTVIRDIREIHKLKKKIAEFQAEIVREQAKIEMLQPWLSLDITPGFTGTKYTDAWIGTLPKTWTLEQLYEALYEAKALTIEIIHTSPEQTCIFVLCKKTETKGVLDNLRKLGFSYLNAANNKEIPMKQEAECNEHIRNAKEIIEEMQEAITVFAEKRGDIQFLIDYEMMRLDKYDVLAQLLQSDHAFVLTGYIPKREVAKLEKRLHQTFEVALEFEEVDETEEAPVEFANNAFAAPLEGIVESFSPPGRGEIDPTMVMSLFYYLLFGLMLSDAAYGFVIAFACGFLLLRFRHMERGTRDFLKMFFFCGIATIFWGVLFGSYFGDLITVVSNTFFGKTVTIAPLWFEPVKDPMRMLVFSMLVGLIHLYTGLAMKGYQCIKQKQYDALIYDVLFWYGLLTSCVVYLLSMKMFVDILGLSFQLSAQVGKFAAIGAAVCSIGIIATSGRESKNPFKRFLKGLYGLYGITGYLSDVLSYSRLLALGLATGVICTVINKMGSMAGNGIPGVIVFVIVFLLGHILNLAINALGAYVHTNRLQYVEFFGKFYEGGGRKFEPFRAKTNYYKIKEKREDE